MRMIFLINLLVFNIVYDFNSNNDLYRTEISVRDEDSYNNLNKQIILLIDVSGSLTKESQQLAINYAGKIANALPANSQLLIYTTEKNSAQQAIVNVKKPALLRPSEKKDFESKWPATVKQIKETVAKNCQKQQSTSCILRGLKSVQTGIAGASKAKHTYLLVISDMLECCDLGCPKTAKDFVKMKEKLSKSDLGNFKLSDKIPQDHVMVCYINQNAKPETAAMIDSPEFLAFWKEVFIRLGYSGMPEPMSLIEKFIDMVK